MDQNISIRSYVSTMAVLMICGIFVVSQVYLLIPLISTLKNHYTISTGSAEWVISAFGFAYAVGFLTLGPLSDCYSRKKFIAVGLIALSIVTFMIGFVQSYSVLIVLRVIQGLVASIFAPTAMAYVGDYVQVNRRVLGLSLLIMCFALSGIVGQVYSSLVNEFLNWQWLFCSLAVIYLIMSVIVLRNLKEIRQQTSNSGITKELYMGMVEHLRNPTLLPLYFITFVILMSFVAVYTMLGGFLGHKFALDPNKIVYIRMAGIPSMCLSPIAGLFARKIGGTRVVVIGLVILILGLLSEFTSTKLVYFVLASALFDAGVAITTPGVVVMLNKLITHAKGAALSLYTFFLFVGAGLGPLVSETLHGIGFNGLCLVFMGVFLLCIVLLLFSQRRLKQNLNPAG